MKHMESPHITRRSILAAGAAIGTALAAGRPLLALEDGIVPTMVNAAAKAKIDVHPLRRGITVLEGSGGNIAVLPGKDGKLLVDAGFSVSRRGITAALQSISPDPIRDLVNTHWHTDHTDGNAWLHSDGADITAHENTKKRLAVATRVEGWNYTFPAAPEGALPVTVFATTHNMRRNSTQVTLNYYGPAHTDCDISVHFAEADVIHVGDIWWNGVYPFIDYSTGGSIDGLIRAAAANARNIAGTTIVIPGHGAIGGHSDLVEFHDMLATIRENVSALKKRGGSLKETIAARPTAQFDAKWGNFLITPAMFVGLVYQGV